MLQRNAIQSNQAGRQQDVRLDYAGAEREPVQRHWNQI